MGTYIAFTGAGKNNKLMNLKVREEPDEVLATWADAGGSPFGVHREPDGSTVYINPGTVAYMHEVMDPEARQARREARRARREAAGEELAAAE